MKQAQNARKQRGRSAPRKGGKPNNSNGSNSGNRNDNRSRGNPKQLLEKYKNQARDALQAGDRLEAEYFFQFADHYQRVVNEMQSREPKEGRDNNRDQNGEDGQQNNRRGRGRRGRNHDQRDDQNADQQGIGDKQVATGGEETPVSETPAETAPADIASADQPQEVHPELDLDLNAAPEAEEKPKRRAPARRRSPKKAEEGTDKAEDAPKPRARRTRKPKEEAAADAGAETATESKDGEAAA